MKTLLVNNLDEIENAAQDFLAHIGENKIIAFYGSMGAGKTTFIKALCKCLGSNDVVSSPTFALINEYNLPKDNSLFHFDFYRINKLEEIYDFGYEDYFYSGKLCLIEWPELIEEVLPENSLKVTITEINNGVREIKIA